MVFHVKVNEVKEKQVPAIDDEFAKDVSEFDTLKDLKADIKKKLTAERSGALSAVRKKKREFEAAEATAEKLRQNAEVLRP